MEDGLRARRSTRPRSTSRRRLTPSSPSAKPISSECVQARRSRSSKNRHQSPVHVPSASPPSHSQSSSTSSSPSSRSVHRPLKPCVRRAMRQSPARRGAGTCENEWDAGKDDAGEHGPMSTRHADARLQEKGLAGDRLNIALLLFLYSLQGVPLGAYKLSTLYVL